MAEAESVRFSVVVPAFNEAESLPELVDRIATTFVGIGAGDAFEILISDDGSTDDTPDVISGLMSGRAYVRSVRLRRKCGKSLALMAGFRFSRGDVVISIDADLQDCPEDIPALLEKIEEGYDLANGWRQGRQDSFVRRIGSRIFNWAVGRTTGLRLHDHNCGLKAYRRKVVSTVSIYGQYHRYTPVLAHIAGFNVVEVPVDNSARKYGKSKYRAFRFQGLFDLLSILFIHKYETSPLHFFGVLSLVFVVPSFLMLFYWSMRHLLFLIGLGDEFIFLPRPLFTAMLTAFLLGIFIFLAGFICDFILHHQIRSNMGKILDFNIEAEPKSEASTSASETNARS